jgi:hypothetical protein
MSSSPHANLPPRTSNHYPASNPSRREVAAHDPREMPKSSQNYPAPTKGLGYANRHGPEDTSSVFAGGISVNYRERETSIQVEEASYKLPLSANQYSTQSTYTKRQIQEAEGQVGQLLKDRGKQVSRQDFDKLVNEQLGRLYGSQQQQYHPTPLSSSQGGHKSPSSAVQHTQSMGPGGQNPSPGSVPFTKFSGSEGLKAPPIPVPYTLFPSSDDPPESTQPDCETSRTGAQSQGRGPSNNPSFSSATNTQNMSQPRNPAPQSGNQSGYTRDDVMKIAARKLKDEGYSTITREQLDRAVDDVLRTIQQQQQQQQAPPPYTTQPSTTEAPGFSRPATAGPAHDSTYGQYRY